MQARQALLESECIRSFKSPEADLAEWLVAKLTDGEIAENKSNPAFDVISGDMRIQVKSVSKATDNSNGYIVQEKNRANNPKTGATHYAFVFFKEMRPEAIFLVSEGRVRKWGKRQVKRADLEALGSKLDVDLSVFGKKRHPKFGSAKGLIKIAEDFDAPLEDFKDYMS